VESDVTTGEHKMVVRGVAAGTILGLAIGLITALFIAMQPHMFAAFIR
jgi:hypothetical protein